MSPARYAARADEGSHSRTFAPGRTSAYVLGVATGLAVALFAPLLRPTATRAIKGGIYVGRHAKKVASTLREEFEDMAAEAQAEIEREEHSASGERNS